MALQALSVKNPLWSVGGRFEPRLNLDSPQIVVIVGFGTWVPGLVELGGMICLNFTGGLRRGASQN